ncbi:response regulator [Melioribacter sp. OK-6-Me]|uniref:response regulator n=1 Tax=unclassified Melioribacter TaxID=2627329 RepID=UPI003EDABFC1
MTSDKKKILIIEDDQLLQDFYRILFDKIGFDTIITEDTEELFSYLNGNDVALIIMDVSLRNTYLGKEKIDGSKLSRYIKENFVNLNVPILLVTAYSKSKDGGSLLIESKADDYVLKPIVSIDLFLQKVNRLVYER